MPFQNQTVRRYYERCIRKKRPLEQQRIVYINDHDQNNPYEYSTNKVRTSRYTILTFFPKNLLEQFRRIANVYFLVMAILQVIPQVSPGLNNVAASFTPLVVVLAVTAIKEAIEDFRRYQQDKRNNNTKITILRNGKFEIHAWKKLKIGEVVKVERDHQFPADLVLLSSSNEDGLCYVETANLDGETNLKTKMAKEETVDLRDDPSKLSAQLGCIECDPPNSALSVFDGKLTNLQGKAVPLSNDNLVLRGCVLKNCHWITGVAVYTGPDTKVMQNSLKPRSKMSSLEGLVNRALFIQIAALLVITVICTIVYRVWFSINGGDNLWYLQLDGIDMDYDAWVKFWSFIILFQNVIPISLYVSIELVRVCHAYFISSDLAMYDPVVGRPAQARTSNLSEELGQIDYIFSDKTGTLTRNVMEFLKCSFGGVSYGTGLSDIAKSQLLLANKPAEDLTLKMPSLPTASKDFVFKDANLLSDLKSGRNSQMIRECLLNLALCNSVLPEPDPDYHKGIYYEASSPDEATLVEAAKNLGFTLEKRVHNKYVELDIEGEGHLKVELLALNEFNSIRKRMSTIYRFPDGAIRLYIKGADSEIQKRLGLKQPLDLTTVKNHLNIYANEGLRTLMLAYRDIPEDEWKQWYLKFHDAQLQPGKTRSAALHKCAEEIEKDLVLLGVSAIEDKLQEGVPDTISSLLRANIKIWVLTGDKRDTAINIGYASRLLSLGMEVLVIDGKTSKDDPESTINAQKVKDQLDSAIFTIASNKRNEYALVVENDSALSYVLDSDLAPTFLKLTSHVKLKSVICARCTPGQKASVVKTVKDNMTVRTLSIGDGANDVPMITEAHVGVGISGKEGTQAVMASDYAIAQFSFLKRLLLVHGRWSYRRVCVIVLYSFFKNVVRSSLQFWFQIHSGFSGGTVNDVWSIAAWNLIFTSLPILFVAALDQDVSDEASLKVPQLYIHGQRNREFTLRIFSIEMTYALAASAIVFYVPFICFRMDILSSVGRVLGLWDFGFTTFAYAVIVCNLRIYFETKFLHWSVHATVWGSIASWVVFMLIYYTEPVVLAGSVWELLWTSYITWTTGTFYFGIGIVLGVIFIPLFFVRSLFLPTPSQVVHELMFTGTLNEFIKQNDDEYNSSQSALQANAKTMSITFMNQVDLKSGELGASLDHTGFGFSEEQFGKTRWINRVFKKKRKKKTSNEPLVSIPLGTNTVPQANQVELESSGTSATDSSSSSDDPVIVSHSTHPNIHVQNSGGQVLLIESSEEELQQLSLDREKS